MSKKYYSIPRGIVRETNKEIPQNFDLKKWMKRMLNLFNIPFSDICCDDGEFAPTRYAVTDNQNQYFDITTQTWLEIPNSQSIISTDITADTINVTSANTETLTSDNNNIIVAKNPVQKRTGAAYNVTATATAADLVGGLLTSTSAAAVTLTLPTATDLGTQVAATQGTTVDFIVDNTAGSNTVTVTVNTGITAVTAVVTGGATLTVGSGVAGMFRIYFINATTAKIARLF